MDEESFELGVASIGSRLAQGTSPSARASSAFRHRAIETYFAVGALFEMTADGLPGCRTQPGPAAGTSRASREADKSNDGSAQDDDRTAGTDCPGRMDDDRSQQACGQGHGKSTGQSHPSFQKFTQRHKGDRTPNAASAR